ncbi:putative Phytocyanin domain, cupredoxin [Helianthus annuus]|uniref:Phytocyanin domain, cupredoxin n=2 Tax=Helianthus annuus TaxID=4232 RepID=A0A9K3JJ21_HELAN|nr:putative Phytocyanin domain, cupredoxin [Helianthus annuus]KAJ0602724.1 putative Phytocyanin domain, cupredoxin [Helianthus annuus]KAJ0609554.1 putative Phytocyanin domain, cupredoxin [Helianthus annuus]KAJ0769602.1 putative Phytocyanin domain, cupredoxin [Helianthus annuus]KAJ0775334.1 putative Phytocyanin domain, cupredoxin [Helianthus annuus]
MKMVGNSTLIIKLGPRIKFSTSEIPLQLKNHFVCICDLDVVATFVTLLNSVAIFATIFGRKIVHFSFPRRLINVILYNSLDTVFNYAAGVHNVAKVNGTGFQQCSTSASNGIMTSRRDVVPLQTPGRKWYICGVGKHCESRNMKLVITVLPQTWAPAPSPIATSTSGKLAVPTIYGFVVGLFGSLLLLFV